MAPFPAERRDLGLHQPSGATLALEPFPRREAERLGAAFAAIDPWARYPYPAPQLAAYLAAHEPGAPRLALYSGTTIAGAVGLRLGWLKGPYLQFLGILPDFQGQGIGSAVLEWLEHEARAGGERNLWACASDFNIGALVFYQRHGFERVAALDGLVCDGRAEVLLRKRL